MLAVLRFWFTKDLVEILRGPEKAATNAFHAEICQGEALQAIQFNPRRILSSMSSYPRSGKNGIDFASCNWEVEDKNPTLLGEGHKTSARISSDSKQEVDTTGRPIRVSYITEQTSHHPPVSAFWVDCPVKGISARGFDQLSAKFTGTSVRVTPGAHNLGIFIELAKRDNEEYQLTHPTAHLGGLIRGSLAVTVADTCFVTCPKTRMKTILQYLEEGWLGKTQHKVNGVVYRYDPENDKCTRIKDVSEKDVIARIEGCWHDQIYYTRPGSKVMPLNALSCSRQDLQLTRYSYLGLQPFDRSQTLMARTQNRSPGRPTTTQRVTAILARGNCCHSKQAIRTSYKSEARARRAAARESYPAGERRQRMAATLLQRPGHD